MWLPASRRNRLWVIVAVGVPLIALLVWTPVRVLVSRQAPAENFTVQTVTYCSPGGVGQKMDIYEPSDVANGVARPVVEMVHGGGWTSGAKGPLDDIQPVPEVATVMRQLLAHGFVVTSVNYRLAPQYQFPASIEDVKCSIRYLRAHASLYQLDPQRIGLMGASAGGHLVSLAGLAGPEAGWDGGEYSDQSSAVQAVVDMFGPEFIDCKGCGNAAIGDPAIFGADAAALLKASPPSHISTTPGADPPFLILQGDRDTTVPAPHSIQFYTRLTAAGQSAQLIIVHNAAHEFVPEPPGAQISPSADSIEQSIVSFFLKTLAGENGSAS